MAIDIALDDEEMKKRMQQVAPLAQIQAPPGAPQKPGAVEQFSNMAKQRAMEGALDMGTEAIASKAAEAGLTGSSAMAGAGAAMPYIGAGLLAGKALGFFNNGGHVGPLYAAEGSMPVPISKRNAIAQAIKEDRIKAAERVRAAQQKAEYNKLLRDQEIIDQKVALDRQKADQAASRQGMILDSVLADIGYQNQYGNGMAGPLSKVEYKSAGGEVYKLSYGGPISKGV